MTVRLFYVCFVQCVGNRFTISASSSGNRIKIYLKDAAPFSDYTILSSSWIYDKSIVSDDAKAIAEDYCKKTGTLFPTESFGNSWIGSYTNVGGISAAIADKRDI